MIYVIWDNIQLKSKKISCKITGFIAGNCRSIILTVNSQTYNHQNHKQNHYNANIFDILLVSDKKKIEHTVASFFQKWIFLEFLNILRFYIFNDVILLN
jgi:hypothetical protein